MLKDFENFRKAWLKTSTNMHVCGFRLSIALKKRILLILSFLIGLLAKLHPNDNGLDK